MWSWLIIDKSISSMKLCAVEEFAAIWSSRWTEVKSSPDELFDESIKEVAPAKIDLHAVLLITLDNWAAQNLSVLWILPL